MDQVQSVTECCSTREEKQWVFEYFRTTERDWQSDWLRPFFIFILSESGVCLHWWQYTLMSLCIEFFFLSSDEQAWITTWYKKRKDAAEKTIALLTQLQEGQPGSAVCLVKHFAFWFSRLIINWMFQYKGQGHKDTDHVSHPQWLNKQSNEENRVQKDIQMFSKVGLKCFLPEWRGNATCLC